VNHDREKDAALSYDWSTEPRATITWRQDPVLRHGMGRRKERDGSRGAGRVRRT